MRHVIIHVLDRTPRPEVAVVPEVILTTLLTHHLDLARWFGGEVAPISARFGPPDPAAAQLRRDVALTLEFAGGAVGAIVAGYRDGLTRTSEHADDRRQPWLRGDRRRDRSRSLWTTDPDRLEVFTPSPFTDEAGFYDHDR